MHGRRVHRADHCQDASEEQIAMFARLQNLDDDELDAVHEAAWAQLLDNSNPSTAQIDRFLAGHTELQNRLGLNTPPPTLGDLPPHLEAGAATPETGTP